MDVCAFVLDFLGWAGGQVEPDRNPEVLSASSHDPPLLTVLIRPQANGPPRCCLGLGISKAKTSNTLSLSRSSRWFPTLGKKRKEERKKGRRVGKRDERRKGERNRKRGESREWGEAGEGTCVCGPQPPADAPGTPASSHYTALPAPEDPQPQPPRLPFLNPTTGTFTTCGLTVHPR